MSEQPGHAAGTAGPNQPSTPINSFNKPWELAVTGSGTGGLINDRDGETMAFVLSTSGRERSHSEIVAIGRHIIACVNFCQDLYTELLEDVARADYTITVERLEPPSPDLCVELAANSESIHNSACAHSEEPLPGGVI